MTAPGISTRRHRGATANTPTAARRGAMAAAALTLVAGGLTIAPWGPTSGAAGPVFTPSLANGHDDAKTSWYPEQTALTPALVTGGTFGKLWDAVLDQPADRFPGPDQLYGQPLVYTSAAGTSTVIVATEANALYGFDPTTGARRYKTALGEPFDPTTVLCGDLLPRIGVTGTPAIDPATGTAYVLSKQTAGAGARYVAYAYDPTTGAVQWSTEIAGSAQNAPGTVFDAKIELQRPGLIINQGVLYAAFGGHCDRDDYRGWVVGVDLASHRVVTLFATQPGGTTGSGIWQSGGGIMSDGPGRLFVATGNAITGAAYAGETPIASSSPPSVLGEAVIRLDVQPDHTLRPGSFFMPYDAQMLDLYDTDFGSSGPIAIPPAALPPSQSTAHVLVATGKEGYVYLLDRDNLGGYKMGAGGGDLAVDRVGPDGGAWTKPAVWPGTGGDGGYVYIVTATPSNGDGASGVMNAYRVVDAGSHPALQKVGATSDVFAFGSGASIVTSVGTTPGTGIVWTVWSPGTTIAGGELRAYGATPDANGVLPLLGRFPVGLATKFASPVASGNRLFVPTRDGHLYAFGAPIDQPLSLSTPTFTNSVVGQSSAAEVTVTANTAAVLSGLTTSNPAFQVGPLALPMALAAGSSVTVPVVFTPGTPGAVTGQLTVTADVGSVSTVLNGRGLTAAGALGANPVALSLGGSPIGGTIDGSFLVTNIGASPLEVTAVDGAAPPFTVSAPALPFSLAAGAEVRIGVSFAPQLAGNFSIGIKVSAGGTSLTVPVSASAAVPGHRTVSPSGLSFLDTLVGGHRTKTFTVGNDGGSPFTVTISKPPVGASFSASSASLPEGTSIAAGGLRLLPVRFAPRVPGPVDDTWDISTSEGSGRIGLPLHGNGVASVVVGAPTSDWVRNGAATVGADGTLELTPDAAGRTGGAWRAQPIATDHVEAHFTAELDGTSETPGDGLTFALADATQLTSTATGAGGGGLGFGGIPGAVGVAITTSDATGSNLVGVVASQPDGSRTWVAPPVSISPDLHGAAAGARPVPVDVWIDRDATGTARATVLVDATPVVVDLPVDVPARAFVGFTAATSDRFERHAIAPGATILAGSFAAATCPDTVSGWKGELFVGTEPGTSPIACRDDAAIAFDWGTTAPAAGVPPDGFSARWTRTIATGARTYTFATGSDDGSRLFVDGRLVLNAWKQQTYTPRSVRVPLTAGLHTVVFEYFDATGPARAQLSIR